MSKQCLSIEQMKHLNEIGLDTSNASACWFRVLGFGDLRVFTLWSLAFNKYISKTEGLDTQIVPTFTLQDILDLLPEMTTFYKLNTPTCDLWYTKEDLWCNEKVSFEGENIIDTAYEALLWCIENGYVKTNKED